MITDTGVHYAHKDGASRGLVGFYLLWLAVALTWAMLLRILALYWLADSQYSYGWIVPIFSFYAGWLRWPSRPPIGNHGWPVYSLAAIALIGVAPTWLIVQPNPDWRIYSWLLAAEVIVITMGAVSLAGGLSWARHFAFPICLILVAVPWPRPLEIPIVEGLMRGVAGLTAELLNIAGFDALQHGNVIELRTGLLGVEEACSGIRSLQASLMASLVFGELYWAKWTKRFFLAIASVAVAFAMNVCRTFSLSWIADSSGISAMDRWHDTASIAVLSACFVILWALGRLLGSRRKEPAPRGSVKIERHARSPAFGIAVLLWISAILAGTEAWYYDGGEAPMCMWSLQPPANAKPFPISESAADSLQADQSVTGSWTDLNGSQWRLFYFEWDAGPMRSRILANLHRPDLCLSAIGLKLVKDRGSFAVNAGGFSLPFTAYRFDENGRPLFVYFGVWQFRSERGLSHGPLSTDTNRAGLQAVQWRERDLGQQMAEFAVSGYVDEEDADAAFRAEFPKRLLPSTATQR